MSKKIYLYSGSTSILTSASLAEFKEKFEVIPNQSISAEAVIKNAYDYIEMAPQDFDHFKNLIPAVSWKVNQLGVADTLVKEGNFYRPLNLTADSTLYMIQKKMPGLSTSASVMIVGDYHFALSITAKLALAGFSKFIVSLDKDENFPLMRKKLNEFIFNLNIEYISYRELTQLSSTSSMLISNISKEANEEAYESLAYFNFLIQGSVFVDTNSEKCKVLVEEARRAEINVVEEIEILTLKYKTLLESSKISSFV